MRRHAGINSLKCAGVSVKIFAMRRHAGINSLKNAGMPVLILGNA
jgi:hypothetical protein